MLIFANKTGKFQLASFLVCFFIALFLLPIMFFNSGGILSGMSHWFVMALVFTFLLTEGKAFYALVAAETIEYIIVYAVAYWFPESVTPIESLKSAYVDIGMCSLLTAYVAGAIFKYQTYVYEKEKEITVTQNKMLQNAMKEAEDAKEEALIASRAKGRFLANMTHELRTPMNAICGMAELLTKSDLCEKDMDYAKTIQSSGQKLLEIINDILDYSKAESGKMETVAVKYYFRETLHDVSNVAQLRIKEKENLKLITQMDAALPEVLLGDEGRIRQILINLLGNAIKFTDAGSIILTTEWEGVSATEGNLHILVSDTGTGVKKEDMTRIFCEFEQVDRERNHSVEGTGLGLPICKSLAELMGGTISVESEYGKGSTFHVVIPQQIDKEEKVEITQSYLTAPGAKVLLVDDNKVNLKVAAAILHKFQVETVCVEDGIQAIDEIKKNPTYDIILMDHMMPDMDGIESSIAIRALEGSYYAKVPIIALSANDQTGNEVIFTNAGMDDYLAKPISLSSMERILRSYLPKEKIV